MISFSTLNSQDLDLLTLLTDGAIIAGWNNEGLPSDRMSSENAMILENCERWPLMIDPQLQVGGYCNRQTVMQVLKL